MTQLDLREELRAQHAELRELGKLVRAAAANATSSAAALAELRMMLGQLADELLAHNFFEEQALSAVYAEIADAELRVVEHHAAEHAVIFAALAGARQQCEATWLAGEAYDVIELLETHLDREDRELERGTLLRDLACAVGS